jgi:NADPH:quinone reductase-like Zn-dependent oxidoreductase
MSGFMKAAVCTRYGPPTGVVISDVPMPVVGEKDVLIAVEATTVSSGDARIRSLRMPTGFGLMARLVFGISRPRQPIFGTELAGVVAQVGSSVRHFHSGDKVFAFPGVHMRAHAEYCLLPENGLLLHRPGYLSVEEAAALCFGGTTALFFLRDKGRIRAGHKVLILGASGCVGTAAIQLACFFGAEVTGVASLANHDLLRSLGAHHVIDYRTEDFTSNGVQYDLILDCVDATTFARAKGSLSQHGRLLMVAAGLPAMIIANGYLLSRRKAIATMARERIEDLRFLAAMAESGAFRPVIDSVHSLAAIADAHARVDSGRKRGSVVVRVSTRPSDD